MANRAQRETQTASMRDRIQKRMQEQHTEGGAWAVSLPEGKKYLDKLKQKMNLDFLPYQVTAKDNPEAAVGELWFRRKYGIHRNVGVDGKMRICPHVTLNMPCPICDIRTKLLKGNVEDKKLAATLRPKLRELYNVIDLDNEDAGVQVWDVSFYLFGKLLEEELNNDETGDFAGFPELSGGYTVKARMKEKSIPGDDGKAGEPFWETTRIDFERRGNYKDDVLTEVVDLDKTLKILTYEQLEKEFLGLAEYEPDKETEAAVPARLASQREEAPALERASRRGPASGPTPAQVPQCMSRREPESALVATLAPTTTPAPQRMARARVEEPAFTPAAVDNKCLHGHEFGVDTEAKDECGQCTTWNDCGDEYDKRKAAKARK